MCIKFVGQDKMWPIYVLVADIYIKINWITQGKDEPFVTSCDIDIYFYLSLHFYMLFILIWVYEYIFILIFRISLFHTFKKPSKVEISQLNIL